MTRLTRVLATLDPVPSPSVTDAERDADLEKILAQPFAAPRRRRRPYVLVTAAAAVLLGVAFFFVVPAPRPAFAATPPPLRYSGGGGDAVAALLAIAARAEASPAPVRGGDYDHLVMVSWYLSSRIDGDVVSSAIIPTRTELWRGPGNIGKMTTSYGRPQFPPGSSRLSWLRQGAPGLDESSHTGDFTPMWPGQPPLDGLATWLEQNHSTDNGPAEMIVAVTDLARERVLVPPVRAGLDRKSVV